VDGAGASGVEPPTPPRRGRANREGRARHGWPGARHAVANGPPYRLALGLAYRLAMVVGMVWSGGPTGGPRLPLGLCVCVCVCREGQPNVGNPALVAGFSFVPCHGAVCVCAVERSAALSAALLLPCPATA
jgi:hypothetical protein